MGAKIEIKKQEVKGGIYDSIIIGAGPAGLNAALYLRRYGSTCMILTNPEQPSQVDITPFVDNYIGIQDVTGAELTKMMAEHAKKFDVEIKYEKVGDIKKENDNFIVVSEKDSYKAKTVVIATGAKHRNAEVKGESEFLGKGVSYCATCDGFFFKDKKVAVIGGGDSALTSAIFLKELGCDVTLIHRRSEFRAAEVYVEKAKQIGVKFKLERTVFEIAGGKMVEKIILDNWEEFDVSGVFVAIGEIPAVEIAKKAGVKVTESGFIVTDKGQMTNVPGIFAAGDVCDNPLKQIITACADGAVAAFSIKKWLGAKK